VARLTALRGDEAVLVTGVEALQVVLGDGDRGLELRERAFSVVEHHRLRRLELLAVLGVPGGERGLVGRCAAEALERQHGDAHLTLLVLDGQTTTDLSRGYELREPELKLRVLQARADVVAELVGADADLREPRERQRLAVLAVDLEGRFALDLLTDTLAADAVARIPAALADDLRADEAFQHTVLKVSALRLRDVRAELLLPTRLLVAPGVVGLRKLDALPVHLGRPRLGPEEVHADHARGATHREDEREGGQDESGQDLLALQGIADFLEHGRGSAKRGTGAGLNPNDPETADD